MFRIVLLALAMLMAITSLTAEAPEPVLALKGNDPVALIDGKELPGDEKIEFTHGLFRYRFINEANRKLFQTNPEDYGIQLGGACGRMGPFSGNGSPARYHVHNRRIYVFASESCRNSFKLDPVAHIELPNAVPEGTDEQKRCGAELVELALKGFGGAEKVDALRSLQTLSSWVFGQGKNQTVAKHNCYWSAPDLFRVEDVFSTAYGYTLNGKQSIQLAGKAHWALTPSLQAVARRQVLREPWILLTQRKKPGFIAIARGKETLDGVPVDLVDVALDGATSTWYIDSNTRRILEVAYEAQRTKNGLNVVKYSDFRDVDGLTLPFASAESFNGKTLADPVKKVDNYLINADIKKERFSQP
jgi:YHS domain-containing protein